ncbi:class I SAM-dependent methyltransferase [Angustibacter sp. Root456]|uniref:class I SAM-dependent methyltransferase n=1 Tax=Angustibacter sp. Root456 TaxID=1736539 RepID=UPI000700617F|nr:class I SAM-dependent methyltransferase [Angustibacter sp. Root456]KQX62916.1 hypothetical protein ASD06_12955 [Angustibacter sp. Root456]
MNASDVDLQRCPLCGTDGGRVVHRAEAVPVHSCLLVDSRDDALSLPRGTVTLVMCEHCGHLANRSFDEGLTAYSGRYEDSQAFSPTFTAYGTSLAERWVGEHRLQGRRVLEIGAGRGDFSRMLVGAGVAGVDAMDPTIVATRAGDDEGGRIRWVAEAFDDTTGAAAVRDVDAVTFRHVLEHVNDPRALLGALRAALGERTDVPVLVEVPDATRVLAEGAFWDVYYEHCAYFVPSTVAALFEACGFEVRDVSLVFDGQYLLVTAFAAGVPSTPHAAVVSASELRTVEELAGAFEARVEATTRRWRGELDARSRNGSDVVLWGSGSKPTAFLSAMGPLAATISRVVDVNPYKQGRFMLGSGLPIVAPASLAAQPADLVVIMNPVYRNEIENNVRTLCPDAQVTVV